MMRKSLNLGSRPGSGRANKSAVYSMNLTAFSMSAFVNDVGFVHGLFASPCVRVVTPFA